MKLSNRKICQKIAARLFGDAEVKKVGRYEYLWSDEVEGKAHYIYRTENTDGKAPRFILAPSPVADEPELHLLFAVSKKGEVVKCLAAYRDDYLAAIAGAAYSHPQRDDDIARLRMDELETLPGFIDITAEARAAA